jgi:DNA-binding MarR family transcriptional regulator
LKINQLTEVPMPDQRVEDTSQRLLALLPLLSRLVASEVRREVGDSISMPQLRMLITLLEEARTLSSLAREYHVSPQALCDVAHALVERGWLARRPHPADRRQHLLAVTDVGRAALADARERALQQITPLLTDLSDRELDAVGVALPALHRVLARTGAE